MGGVLNPPICPYCIQPAPFLLVTPRCLYISPSGESRQSHVFSCYLHENIVGWDVLGVGRKTTEKMQLTASLIIQVSLVTGWLGNGVVPSLHIDIQRQELPDSTHAHSDQPSPAPLLMLTRQLSIVEPKCKCLCTLGERERAPR